MEYLKTHPWIRFSLDLRQCDFRLWLMLGEIASKIEHLSGAALRPDVADELNKIYLTKGVRATTAIEGNTLSEEQVQLQVEGKLDLPPPSGICSRRCRTFWMSVTGRPSPCWHRGKRAIQACAWR